MSKWGNAGSGRGSCRARWRTHGRPLKRLTKVLFLIARSQLGRLRPGRLFGSRANITRPLQDLTQAVDQMRTGTYDATLNVQRRDELGVLAVRAAAHADRGAIATTNRSGGWPMKIR